MPVRMLAIGLLAAASMSSTAFAEDAAPASTPDDGRKVICKKERPTGSRIATRVCLTKAEWDAATDAAQDALRARGADRSAFDNKMSNPGTN